MVKRGQRLSVLLFIIPVIGATSVPAYKYIANLGLPAEYQQNASIRDKKASEHAALRLQLDQRTLQMNIDGGLFEEQREIEQFFSFIADEVVRHRLTTKSFSQSEVVVPTVKEGEEQPFYLANPGAKLDLSGDYASIMAFLAAIRDLDKEVLVEALTLGRLQKPEEASAVEPSTELELSLSLQVFRLVSAQQ